MLRKCRIYLEVCRREMWGRNWLEFKKNFRSIKMRMFLMIMAFRCLRWRIRFSIFARKFPKITSNLSWEKYWKKVANGRNTCNCTKTSSNLSIPYSRKKINAIWLLLSLWRKLTTVWRLELLAKSSRGGSRRKFSCIDWSKYSRDAKRNRKKRTTLTLRNGGEWRTFWTNPHVSCDIDICR